MSQRETWITNVRISYDGGEVLSPLMEENWLTDDQLVDVIREDYFPEHEYGLYVADLSTEGDGSGRVTIVPTAKIKDVVLHTVSRQVD